MYQVSMCVLYVILATVIFVCPLVIVYWSVSFFRTKRNPKTWVVHKIGT